MTDFMLDRGSGQGSAPHEGDFPELGGRGLPCRTLLEMGLPLTGHTIRRDEALAPRARNHTLPRDKP